MTKADQLAAVLDEFLRVSPDVEAAAVVSGDGLPIASALPPHVEEDRLAAMSAALVSLGERAALGLEKGELAQVFVEGVSGYVVLMAAGASAVFVAVTSKNAKVGLVLYEMRRSAAAIARIMAAVAEPPEPAVPATPVAPPPAAPENSGQEWAPQPEAGSTLSGGWT